jgi:hypothetical protein
VHPRPVFVSASNRCIPSFRAYVAAQAPLSIHITTVSDDVLVLAPTGGTALRSAGWLRTGYYDHGGHVPWGGAAPEVTQRCREHFFNMVEPLVKRSDQLRCAG